MGTLNFVNTVEATKRKKRDSKLYNAEKTAKSKTSRISMFYLYIISHISKVLHCAEKTGFNYKKKRLYI